ncbi:helix-turn-helix domain-containing protein [Sinirhodobacter huangdaonensis]|uniref:XRE family transcriptional regulator n=1 Tax=Paenirhodobacter huangdaonensis TaxID=2501515 RepID=A0A3S3MM85_9RHOB|nr:helix-turn-helix transcriptional regulator [Sinirhodobacter huangdaonensis]RWR48407.1 XRE family transcriptional regulator [Sinirhodobacter huangdaonensis]
MSKTIHSLAQQALVAALARMRKEMGLSQMTLAERLHCHQSMIARIESGERRIDVVELVIIARAIGVSPHAVLTEVVPHIGDDLRL